MENKQENWETELIQLLSTHHQGQWHSESEFISELKKFIASLLKKKVEKVGEDVQEIIINSKVNFFVRGKEVKILPKELLTELQTQFSSNVGIYFYETIKELEAVKELENNKHIYEALGKLLDNKVDDKK